LVLDAGSGVLGLLRELNVDKLCFKADEEAGLGLGVLGIDASLLLMIPLSLLLPLVEPTCFNGTKVDFVLARLLFEPVLDIFYFKFDNLL
jgi:hypothetical protein